MTYSYNHLTVAKKRTKMKMDSNLLKLVLVFLVCLLLEQQVECACRVSSEKLKSYTRSKIEKILDVESLRSIYWPDEPLNAEILSKVFGINITLADTHFEPNGPDSRLLRDSFVTCSADRDRSHSLTIDLEVNNPFKELDFVFQGENSGYFHVHMPHSTFLVQLNQRIRYDECLEVNYVQLAPNVRYDLVCVSCDQKQKDQLDRSFNKRMAQIDSEIDSILSEKLLLGLKSLLNQQRLDLDL